MKLEINRFKRYSRKDFHNMFTPNKKYVEGAGVWGIRGIVKVPESSKDFVFFVTLGAKEGEHTFVEGMTRTGLVIWQSQPKQELHHLQIRTLISHDETKNDIYLMFRSSENEKYVYLGKLAYEGHDETREKPVHFIWKLLDTVNYLERIEKLGMPVKSGLSKFNLSARQTRKKNKLVKTTGVPKYTRTRSVSQTKKQGKLDYEKTSRTNKKIGDAGEMLVVRWEEEKLKLYGINKEVVHVALLDDNKGYDIKSYDLEGKPIYIEVKTTKGGLQSQFFISPNEVDQSKKYGDKYRVYRLYNFNEDDNSAEYFELKGDIEKYVELVPSQYQIRYK